MHRVNSIVRAIGIAGAMAAGLGAAAAAERVHVGVTSAVNPETSAIPSAADRRTLYLGSDVFFEERIRTSQSGQAQILFLDESALTIGPNSEVMIDKFIYDPNRSTGELLVEFATGIFRYVGGRISKHKDGVRITTPVANVGIRGAVALFRLSDGCASAASNSCSLQVVCVFCESISVDAGGETEIIRKSGYQIRVAGPGAEPSAPEPAKPEDISGLLDALESKPGMTAGATELPTDAQALALIQPAAGPADAPPSGDASPAGGTTNDATGPSEPDVSTEQQTAMQRAAAESAAPSSGGAAPAPEIPPGDDNPPPDDIPPPIEPPALTLSGRYKSTSGEGAALGTNDFSAAFNRPFAGGEIKGDRLTAVLGGDILDLPAPNQAQFNVDPAGTASPLGPLAGTGFRSADGAFYFYELEAVNAPGEKALVFAGAPTEAAALQSSGFAVDAYMLRPAFMLETNVPFLRRQGGGDFPVHDLPPLLVARKPEGSLATDFSTGSDATRMLFGFVGINGQGASQKSVQVVGTGFLGVGTASNPIWVGTSAGMARRSAGDQLVTSALATTSVPDASGNHLFGGDGIDHFVLDNAATGGVQVLERLEQGAGTEFSLDRTSVVDYSTNVIASRTDAPAGIGATRTERTLNGYAAGLAQAFDLTTGTFEAPVNIVNQGNGDPGQVIIRTFPSANALAAQFNVQLTDFGDQTNVATLNFGDRGITEPPPEQFFSAARSAFIDDDHFGAREQRLLVADGLSSDDTSTFNASPVARATMAMVSGTATRLDGVLPEGVAFCQCEYLEWGYWSGDISPSDSPDRIGIHLATWVAGDLPDLVEVPLQGVATYTGHAIGNVFTNGLHYVAVGSFRNEWNFGTRSGSISIGNFDGVNFAGNAVSANGRDYSGAFAGALPDGTALAGALNGSFFRGGGDPAAETGGQFTVQNDGGTVYRAAGTFAAKR